MNTQQKIEQLQRMIACRDAAIENLRNVIQRLQDDLNYREVVIDELRRRA